MTPKEASSRFYISMEQLKCYEENGLILYETFVNGIPDYAEEELRNACLTLIWSKVLIIYRVHSV